MRPAIAFLALLSTSCGATADAEPVRVSPSGPARYFLAVEVTSEMSEMFQLVWYRVTVDGRPLAERGVPAPSDAAASEVIPTPACQRAMVQAGTHDVTIELRFRGHGYGVFSYLRGYTFDVRSTTPVDVAREAFGAAVKAVGYEGGGATAPLEDRPRVRWEVAPHRDSPNAGCQPDAATP